MADVAPIVSQTLVPFTVSLLGDIVDDGGITGTLDSSDFTFATGAICGVIPGIVVTAEDSCFFSVNACGPLSWVLTSGSLPFGVRLDPVTGVYTVSSSILLIRGNGPGEFTVTMTDSCGNQITETYYTITNPAPPAAEPAVCCWALGDLWSITTLCAYQGTYGLQRTADGITSTSDAVNSTVIGTSSGQTYFLAFYARSQDSANGVISLGLQFYDSNGDFISFLSVDTDSVPTDWTRFTGNVTAPANAFTASATIRATGHTTGTWCVDIVFVNLTGGYWVLSGIKHYYDPYTAYR